MDCIHLFQKVSRGSCGKLKYTRVTFSPIPEKTRPLLSFFLQKSKRLKVVRRSDFWYLFNFYRPTDEVCTFGRCLMELERIYGIHNGGDRKSLPNNSEVKSQEDIASELVKIHNPQIKNCYKHIRSIQIMKKPTLDRSFDGDKIYRCLTVPLLRRKHRCKVFYLRIEESQTSKVQKFR